MNDAGAVHAPSAPAGPFQQNQADNDPPLRSREDTMRLLASAVIAVAVTFAGSAAAAEQYPSRNVRLIVPYPPGGNVDSAARIIADKLQEKLGKPFIVENKAGAGGLIAGEAFAKSDNDGYNLFVGANGPVLFAPLINKRDAYQWKRDFVPITTISMTPLVLEVHPKVEAKTAKEFFDLVKREPGKMGLAGRRHDQSSAQRARAIHARPAMAHRALPRQRAGDQ
jgi:tripartite-type tricarboxylate transporter receptor subunit TctC